LELGILVSTTVANVTSDTVVQTVHKRNAHHQLILLAGMVTQKVKTVPAVVFVTSPLDSAHASVVTLELIAVKLKLLHKFNLLHE
jgi:hypothetical protein